MRYKFNSNADLPEWVLAEVSTLSKISCVRLKLITRLVITEMSGGVLDVEKVVKLVPPTGITWSDIRAMLAAISFILNGAVRNAVDEVNLNEELQQLGLPRENSDGISRPYRIHRERLRQQAMTDSLRCPRLLSLDWRVDALVCTSALGQVRRLQAGSSSGAGAEGGLGEAITSLRLGLSHAAGTLPQRTPASDAAATPLLLGSAAVLAAARAGAGSAAAPAPPRMSTPLDLAEARAAMGALGIRPLEHAAAHAAAGLLGGGSASPSATSAAHHAAEGSTGILSPAVFVDVSLSADAAASFLAELRVANAILQKTAAALPSHG